jgi:hypothetical protein
MKKLGLEAHSRNNKLYVCWQNMIRRCYDNKTNHFENYGGRGIIVCDDWRNFDNFYNDMHISYKIGLPLDRKDNNGNYSKHNCHWVTQKHQLNNTSRNRFITYGGKTLTLSQWAEEIGVKRSTFAQRFYVYKWSLNRIFGGIV